MTLTKRNKLAPPRVLKYLRHVHPLTEANLTFAARYPQSVVTYVRDDVHHAVVAERDALAIRIAALESTPTDVVV